ncbi:hypothetical protein [Sphingomonas sanguinis]|jgi:hypothetical protein|uniref:Uncharacterized protein n=1 Tax=Sphingomonas sanguinis TaxID=33051 RepID=A0A7Y7QYF9_9SPHN|nr:hypothetical protein [Sphingomonas sanguinis]MBZ6383763.1 hypothetical protein [Sphingomonas sanguinis]NNG49684.1 hypothetical protein [Sphingomonas sanguinis]NNG52759.1 hypothetical protein [Sphingomonas sanguinis]NVP33054.1 hypothetical protein [Sphingomonas sanguinis]
MQAISRFLFTLWVTTAALQAFALNIGGNPLFYYYLVQVLLVGLGFVLPTRPANRAVRIPMSLLLAFLLVATIGTFALPAFYAGTPAFVPRISIDEQMLGMTPASFSLSNVVQLVYLTTNVIAVVFAAQGRFGDLTRPFRYGALGAAGIIALSIFADWLQLSFWTNGLSDILRNNEAGAVFDNLILDNVRRISGSFSEPSYAGVFSSALSAYFLSRFLEEKRIVDLGAGLTMALCVILTTSLLGVVGLLVTAGLLVFRYMRRYFLIFAALCVGAVGFYLLHGIAAIDQLYLNRSGESTINRLTSDARSFEILSETNYLGLGLGSHRASSLFSTMLANTGLVGGLLYLAALLSLFLTRVPDDRVTTITPLRFFVLTAWTTILFGAPELSTPSLWTGVVAFVSLAAVPVRSAPSYRPRPAMVPAT